MTTTSGQKCAFNFTGCRALSDSEIDKILGEMTGRFGLRDRAIFIFGCKTGFRIAEILSLRVRDIFDGEAIRDAVTIAGKNLKGGKRYALKSRSMPMHMAAKEAIRAWLRMSKMDHPFYANYPLFPAQGHATPLNPKQYWAIFKAAARRSGIDCEHVATHSMRKCLASRAWASPQIHGDLCALAAVLGHRDPATSARYVRFADGALESVVLSL
ncbi:MAG: tyrosine-type recombinase/integrase [Chthoniobacteraceae bacterium]